MPGESLTSPRRIAAKERQRQALELRIAGVTFAAIADRLGYATAYGAYLAVDAALKATLRPAADALRELDTERLDKLQLAVWPAALRGDLAAIDRCLKILAQRARLLGLDLGAEHTPAQPLLPGQREVTMRIVYDAPPVLPQLRPLPELEASTNGHGSVP